jgi:hypothetical protein
MKPYKVRVEVTTAYTVEVHAELQEQAEHQVGTMDLDQIENAGEFAELVKVEVVDSEMLHPEDQDDENVGVEPEYTEEDQADLAEFEEALAEPGSAPIEEFVDLDSLKAPEGSEEEEEAKDE